jgi:hypothetical protein
MASIVYHSCGFFLPLDRLRVPREVLVTGPLEKERLPLLDEARDIAFTKNRIAYSRAATSLSIRLSLIRMLSADLCLQKVGPLKPLAFNQHQSARFWLTAPSLLCFFLAFILGTVFPGLSTPVARAACVE